MKKQLYYYHLDFQCPGTSYMGGKAEELAQLLGYAFQAVNLTQHPAAARRHQLFFPGTIIIDGFKIVYPGTAQQLLESYQRKRPLPGSHKYEPLPPGEPQEITPLDPGKTAEAAAVCIPGDSPKDIKQKSIWLTNQMQNSRNTAGFMAYTQDTAVAVVEFLQGSQVIYPIPLKREDALFITCIYYKEGAMWDYRPPLLTHTCQWALSQGYRALSVIAGEERPYPNGPLSLFEQAGFEKEEYLDQVLLRYQWERIYYMTKNL